MIDKHFTILGCMNIMYQLISQITTSGLQTQPGTIIYTQYILIWTCTLEVQSDWALFYQADLLVVCFSESKHTERLLRMVYLCRAISKHTAIHE